MSMDTTITVDYLPADHAEAEHIETALARLAEEFDLPNPDVSAWVDDRRQLGNIRIGCYSHDYQLDRIDTLARIISRLIPGHDVRVEEEGLHDDYWAEAATYRSGRKTSHGAKEWVEHPVTE